MVIDDGLVNRLAHMRARIDRDLVDSQRAAGPSVTCTEQNARPTGAEQETAGHTAGGCPA